MIIRVYHSAIAMRLRWNRTMHCSFRFNLSNQLRFRI